MKEDSKHHNYNTSKRDRVLILICCYGFFGEYSTPIEQQGLKTYITSCASHITTIENEQDIASIVVSGGFSSLDIETSEAETYKNYLSSLLPQYAIWSENSSLNHSEHIAFSLMQMRKKSFNSVHILCDKEFQAKTHILAAGLLENRVPFRVIPIEREDIHPNHNYDMQLYHSLPQEVFSDEYRFLRDYFRTSFKNHF